MLVTLGTLRVKKCILIVLITGWWYRRIQNLWRHQKRRCHQAHYCMVYRHMRRNVYIGGEYTGLQYHRVFYCFPISTCTITLWLRLSTPQVRRCGRQVTAIAAVTQLSVRRTPVFDMLSTPYNWKYSHGCFVQFTVLAIVKPNRIVSCVLRKKKYHPWTWKETFHCMGVSVRNVPAQIFLCPALVTWWK